MAFQTPHIPTEVHHPPPQLALPADVLISVNVTAIFLLTQA